MNVLLVLFSLFSLVNDFLVTVIFIVNEIIFSTLTNIFVAVSVNENHTGSKLQAVVFVIENVIKINADLR